MLSEKASGDRSGVGGGEYDELDGEDDVEGGWSESVHYEFYVVV